VSALKIVGGHDDTVKPTTLTLVADAFFATLDAGKIVEERLLKLSRMRLPHRCNSRSLGRDFGLPSGDGAVAQIVTERNFLGQCYLPNRFAAQGTSPGQFVVNGPDWCQKSCPFNTIHSFCKSMFPPETTHTTFPRPAWPASAHATGQAPAPSAITRLGQWTLTNTPASTNRRASIWPDLSSP
jgi:hypothetical protein